MCTLRALPCLALSFLLLTAATAQGAEDEEPEAEESEESGKSEKPPPEAPAVQLTVTDRPARAPLAPVGPGTQLTRRDLELIPGSFGDPLRAIHSLPGINGDTASRTSFFIRAAPAAERLRPRLHAMRSVPWLTRAHSPRTRASRQATISNS